MSTEKKWFRFVVEACVIVISILLAFGIDAWWDERKASHRELAYLEILRDDVVRTIVDNNRVIDEQSKEQTRILNIAESIRAGANLAADIRTTFPAVTLPAESMDAYRDLVASGGTTLIASPDVRSAMASLLQRVEYNDRAENWALELATSTRLLILSSAPGSMNREHLAELWQVYIDLGERLLDGKNRLNDAAQEALRALDKALGEQE